jgi:molecular chaperone GrpE
MSDNRDAQNENHNEADESSSNDPAINAETTESNDNSVEVEESVNIETSSDIISALEGKLAAANATIEGQKEGVLRARAEMENAKRRAEAEVEKARKFALERFAGELLPVADNLERAIQVADASNEAVKPLLEGVELTMKSFVSTIEKFGLVVIDPQGDTFNPELHQAMSMQESTEVAANTVIAVMQKGYQINGRLLRPAMVMVSRSPDGGVDTQV